MYSCSRAEKSAGSDLGSQSDWIISGAPFAYSSNCVPRTWRAMTLIRWRLLLKGNCRRMPTSLSAESVGGLTTVGASRSYLVVSLTSGSSRIHSVAANIFWSSGSPMIFPSISVSEWQTARLIISGPYSSPVTGWWTAAERRRPAAVSATGTTSLKFRSSSVSVPVLSKQTQLMQPLMLMERGEMQKISALRRRDCAKTTPMVMAAGSAGGMMIVIRSSAFSMI